MVFTLGTQVFFFDNTSGVILYVACLFVPLFYFALNVYVNVHEI